MSPKLERVGRSELGGPYRIRHGRLGRICLKNGSKTVRFIAISVRFKAKTVRFRSNYVRFFVGGFFDAADCGLTSLGSTVGEAWGIGAPVGTIHSSIVGFSL